MKQTWPDGAGSSLIFNVENQGTLSYTVFYINQYNNRIPYRVKKKEPANAGSGCMQYKSVVLHPVVHLSLGEAKDIRGGVGRVFTTANIQEVQAAGSLVQALFVTGRITVEAADILLDQNSSLGIIFFFADDFLHITNLLSTHSK